MENNTHALLDKIAEPVANGLKPRFEDPFLSVYTISFLIWNYQIFIYLFSGMDANQKYAAIQTSINFYSFLGPIVPVILINFIFPWGFKSLYKKSERLKISLSSDLNIERSKHITLNVIVDQLQKEIDHLRNINSQAESQHNETVFNLKKNIEGLREEKITISENLNKMHDADIAKLNAQNFEFSKTIALRDEKIRALQKELSALKETVNTATSTDEVRLKQIVNFLNSKDLLLLFSETFEKIMSGADVKSNTMGKRSLTILLTKDLFRLAHSEFSDNPDTLATTELGKEVYNYLLDTTSIS